MRAGPPHHGKIMFIEHEVHQVNQEHFPKPPPAAPLPEEVWLNQTDRAEVGRESFFCGRDCEYAVFREAVKVLNSGRVGGGTMIFQGAPGAGKSALMQECIEAIKSHSTPMDPWVAVSIPPSSLGSPSDVIQYLIDAADAESQRLLKLDSDATARTLKSLLALGKKMHGGLWKRGFQFAGFSVGGESKGGNRSNSATRAGLLFRNAAPLLRNVRVVVFVDEAQNVPVESATRGVLDCLHRDAQGIQLVAAFFGLSDTEEVLGNCGLSRLPSERIVNLDLLSMDDATWSLRRMLDAYYVGEDGEKSVWSTALAELSQGWAQHINRVGVAAGRIIRSNHGRVELHLLEKALQDGAKLKHDYYARRLAAGDRFPALYKQIALAMSNRSTDFLSEEALSNIAAPTLEKAQVPFDRFLNKTLHAGLLSPVADLPHHYRFPIPSMRDYLCSLPVDLLNTP